MVFHILADATVVIHLSFVLFVILGGLLFARWSWIPWAHLAAVAWGAWIELSGWECPLTPIENWLREQAGLAAYQASFVEHYLIPVLYPSWLSREIQWGLGAFLLLFNTAIYFLILRRDARRDRLAGKFPKYGNC